MNRRSFLSTLILGAVAPMFLPGSGRRWSGSLILPESNTMFIGAGDPESVIESGHGAMYWDMISHTLFVKNQGHGATGWVPIGVDQSTNT